MTPSVLRIGVLELRRRPGTERDVTLSTPLPDLGITSARVPDGAEVVIDATLEAIDVFSTRAKGYGFQIETAYRISQAGRRLAEVPIVFTDRVRGHSKMSMAVAVEELTLVTWWGLRDRVRRLLRRAPGRS